MKSLEPLPDLDILPVEAARDLSPAMRDAQALLLAYKSFFVGPWFQALLAQQASPETAALLRAISERAGHEALQIIAAMQEWERVCLDPDRIEATTTRMRERLLHDLVSLKEAATENVLSATMAAPTADLRDRLVRLADEDRINADMLRRLLGSRQVLEKRLDDGDGGACGAHSGGVPGELVSSRVRRTIDALRATGAQPLRIVLSSVAVRHLRDEGLLGREPGEAFGLPTTVEFAWRGECFAVLTDEAVSLAELATARHTHASVPQPTPDGRTG